MFTLFKILALGTCLVIIVFLIIRIRRLKKQRGKKNIMEMLKVYTDRTYISQLAKEEEERKAKVNLLEKAGAGVQKLKLFEGYQRRLKEKILRAGLRIKPAEYLVINVIFLFIGIILGLIISGKFPVAMKPIVLLIGGIIGFIMPNFYLNMRANKRRRAFENQLVDILSLMSNALKAGYGFLQAAELVAKEAPAPASEEFKLMMRETALGLSTEEALDNMVNRIQSADFELVITAVMVQRQVGGNLAEILDKIAATIRERIRMQGEIRTLTAQGRLGGMVIAGLPFCIGLAFYFLQTEIMKQFLSHPFGKIMIVIGIILQSIGFFAIKKIITIEL